MDGTLNQYLKLSPEQAIEQVNALMKEVKKHGGNFICIWHNDTINNQGNWENWKQVLDATIDAYRNT
jgi:GH25 family lysozyme M1 (1,4-beta-N-acetylmuramidase)